VKRVPAPVSLFLAASALAAFGRLAADPPRPCPALPEVPCRPAGNPAGELSCAPPGGVARTFPAESAFCLSCHEKDGDGKGTGHGKSGPASHPVGTPYPPPGLPGYRPAGSLDGRVRLDGGKVGCRTCHGGPGPARLHLSITSITAPASALCTACHVK
jgi:hypothetical protein